MAWIKQIGPEEAKGTLKDIYSELVTSRGKISNIMKIQSLDPETMKNHLDMYLLELLQLDFEFLRTAKVQQLQNLLQIVPQLMLWQSISCLYPRKVIAYLSHINIYYHCPMGRII